MSRHISAVVGLEKNYHKSSTGNIRRKVQEHQKEETDYWNDHNVSLIEIKN
jgi:hypothetical protein